MSDFVVKSEKNWKIVSEELPEIGKDVEVLCTMVTKACLIGTEPKELWQQTTDAEPDIEVKLWRHIDEAKSE